MRGIILAGGYGTRLAPLTFVTNKHLAPVGNLPMIEYPLHTLRQLGAEEISVVTGGNDFDAIGRYLANHAETNFSFHVQGEAGGIPQALSLGKPSLGTGKIAVILGDNIFEDDFKEAAEEFDQSDLGAMLFLKKVSDPQRYGVVELENGKIKSFEEKPKKPKSDLVSTGLYFFDNSVFDKIKNLRPSKRGELEMVEVLDQYVTEEKAGYSIVKGFWSDAGTIPSRELCNRVVSRGLENKVLSTFPKQMKDRLPPELLCGLA